MGEGGDGSNGECYRHHDRRNVHQGICLMSRYGILISNYVIPKVRCVTIMSK